MRIIKCSDCTYNYQGEELKVRRVPMYPDDMVDCTTKTLSYRHSVNYSTPTEELVDKTLPTIPYYKERPKKSMPNNKEEKPHFTFRFIKRGKNVYSEVINETTEYNKTNTQTEDETTLDNIITGIANLVFLRDTPLEDWFGKCPVSTIVEYNKAVVDNLYTLLRPLLASNISPTEKAFYTTALSEFGKTKLYNRPKENTNFKDFLQGYYVDSQ